MAKSYKQYLSMIYFLPENFQASNSIIPHIRLFLYCLRLGFAIPTVSVGETKPESQSAEKLSGN